LYITELRRIHAADHVEIVASAKDDQISTKESMVTMISLVLVNEAPESTVPNTNFKLQMLSPEHSHKKRIAIKSATK
jgi:hypothetical protein